MSKRKSTADDKVASNTNMDIDGDDDSGSDDGSMLNVDFEWFDPQPAVDFHGLKTLLKQLFDVDNELFDLSALADMILAQPLLGSTVKCDGNESDPFAFLTVLNLSQHRAQPVIQQLTAYLESRAATVDPKLAALQRLLAERSQAQVGLVLTERLINMPHQVVPPMYTMLQEELAWALEEKEAYEFTHYLIVSKTYTLVDSKLDAEANPPLKKKKAATSGPGSDPEINYFHPEDEVLQRHALAHGGYEFEKAGDEGASDARRAFLEQGVRPQGLAVLIEADKFAGAIEAMKEYLGSE